MRDKVTRNCVHRPRVSKREASRSGIEPRSFLLTSLKRLTAEPNQLALYLIPSPTITTFNRTPFSACPSHKAQPDTFSPSDLAQPLTSCFSPGQIYEAGGQKGDGQMEADPTRNCPIPYGDQEESVTGGETLEPFSTPRNFWKGDRNVGGEGAHTRRRLKLTYTGTHFFSFFSFFSFSFFLLQPRRRSADTREQ